MNVFETLARRVRLQNVACDSPDSLTDVNQTAGTRFPETTTTLTVSDPTPTKTFFIGETVTET